GSAHSVTDFLNKLLPKFEKLWGRSVALSQKMPAKWEYSAILAQFGNGASGSAAGELWHTGGYVPCCQEMPEAGVHNLRHETFWVEPSRASTDGVNTRETDEPELRADSNESPLRQQQELCPEGKKTSGQLSAALPKGRTAVCLRKGALRQPRGGAAPGSG